MKKIIFFDLDGTLTDSGLGIMNSLKYGLKKLGIDCNYEGVLRTFVGPPIKEHAEEIFGISKEDSSKLITYYREYFTQKGMYENSVYQGIETVLKNLKKASKILAVATSKPEVHAKEILRHFGLLDYFDYVVGATLDGKISEKIDVIKTALFRAKIDGKNAVMVGDRKYDINGGKVFNMLTVGVTYGYGSEEELINANADYVAKSVQELEKILMEI